ncbi:MAG: diaminopimelate epimerase [Gammaproteobacteria bacterium]|nr:diaminopimelate epimerase [Gammaproteobacteria bacterium]
MELRFTKMHGLGNDFVIADAPPGSPPPSADTLRRLANRRTGIGFDQLLLLEPPRRPDSEVYYRIFNPDGEEVEQCGNGVRCIARLLSERGGTEHAKGETMALDSAGGIVQARIGRDGQISVNMGIPRFAPRDIPFEATTEAYIYTIDVAGTELEIGAVSIGNPHAVLTVPSVDTAPVDRIGPALERHSRFPRRTNVGFMQIIDAEHIRLRVHERGTGETRACGTGACAAVAVGRRHGVLGEEVAVDLPGGRLAIHWEGPGEPIWMTGPAEKSFEGTVDI